MKRHNFHLSEEEIGKEIGQCRNIDNHLEKF